MLCFLINLLDFVYFKHLHSLSLSLSPTHYITRTLSSLSIYMNELNSLRGYSALIISRSLSRQHSLFIIYLYLQLNFCLKPSLYCFSLFITIYLDNILLLFTIFSIRRFPIRLVFSALVNIIALIPIIFEYFITFP